MYRCNCCSRLASLGSVEIFERGLIAQLVMKLSTLPIELLPSDGDASVYRFISPNGTIILKTLFGFLESMGMTTFTFSNEEGKVLLKEKLYHTASDDASNPLNVLIKILSGKTGRTKEISELLQLT